MKQIAVIGFMGSGKTRVGKRLSKDFGIPFTDLDKYVSSRMKMPVAEIYKRFGDPYFRAMETYCMGELAADQKDKVISLSAAFPVQKQNEQIMQQLDTVIYLEASPEVIMNRLEGMPDHPLNRTGCTEEKIIKMMELSVPYYEKYATIRVVTGVKTFDDLIAEIMEKIG